MERIRQEAERFRRHDEAVARSSEEFRRSLRVGDILYSSWGWEQTNIDFYQVIAIRGSAVDLRQLDQRTTEDGYMCGTTVPLPDVFKHKCVHLCVHVPFQTYRTGSVSAVHPPLFQVHPG